MINHVLTRRRPEIVLGAVSDALLAGRDESTRHRETELRLLFHDQRMNVSVIGVLERRNENAGARRAHLMHVVRDRRLVDVLHFLQIEARFDLREHEPVAIVIVADIFVIEVRIDAVIGRIFRFVPVVDDHHLAVRILGRDVEKNGVVEDLLDLFGILGG